MKIWFLICYNSNSMSYRIFRALDFFFNAPSHFLIMDLILLIYFDIYFRKPSTKLYIKTGNVQNFCLLFSWSARNRFN